MRKQYYKPEITVEDLKKEDILLLSAPNRNLNPESSINRDGFSWYIDLG